MSMQPSDFPQDSIASLETDSYMQSLRSFGGMLLLSVALHFSVALYLAIAPRGVDGPQGTVIDVTLSETAPATPAAMTAPVEESELMEDEIPVDPAEVQPPQVTPQVEPLPAPQIIAPPSSIMFGISSGSFASFGDGISLREDIRVYFLDILERINTSWQKEGTGVKLSSQAMLMVSIARNGELQSVQTLQSSGSSMHDRLLARAVANAAPFPPVPDSFSGSTFDTPLRFSQPLSLMSFGSTPVSIPPH